MNLDKYVKYLENVGGSIEIKKFDEDWEPIGLGLRSELCFNGIARQENGVLFLVGYNSVV